MENFVKSIMRLLVLAFFCVALVFCGVEVEFAGMEYEMPYDTVIVELEDENNPGPWLQHKDQLPRHWIRRYS